MSSLSRCWSRSKPKSGENKTLPIMDTPTIPAAQNPTSLHADSIISSLLSFPASTPFSIACSFDRELEKALASASDDASVQGRLLDRTIHLASLLQESTKRCYRKRAAAHNSVAWVLPPELTVKVFSKVDTKSLMQVGACCTVFNKCAMDRSSYAHIDLTTDIIQADNEVVSTMIHRAGKELRSLKLGHVTRRYGPEPNPMMMFHGPFLSSLSYNHGFLGSRLTSLRLYNIRPMNYGSISNVLSVCSNLTDLRIVGYNCPSVNLFMTLSQNCHRIEHMCLGTYHPIGNIDASTASHLIDLVTRSRNLTSLTLLGFQLTNEMVRSIVESSRKLKYLNVSRSPKISGHFLRDLGNSCKESSPLETLILRNCVKLEEKEVLELCNSLLKGNFKFIRHIDVSSNNGLVSNDGRRSYKPKFPMEKLKEERPKVTLVADFPLERSGKRYHVGVEGDDEELREIEMMEAKNDEEGDDNDDDDDDSSDDDDDV